MDWNQEDLLMLTDLLELSDALDRKDDVPILFSTSSPEEFVEAVQIAQGERNPRVTVLCATNKPVEASWDLDDEVRSRLLKRKVDGLLPGKGLRARWVCKVIKWCNLLPHSASHLLESFWLNIWSRPTADFEEAWQAWRPHVPQQPVLPWRPLEGQDLYTQAQKRSLTAAGCDGWRREGSSFTRLDGTKIKIILNSVQGFRSAGV